MEKEKTIPVWLTLDIDGKIRYPSVSVHDTRDDAEFEANRLNRTPGKGTIKVVKGKIIYKK